MAVSISTVAFITLEDWERKGLLGHCSGIWGWLKTAALPVSEQAFDRLILTDSREVFLCRPVLNNSRLTWGEVSRLSKWNRNYLGEIEQTWCRYPYLDLDVALSEFGLEAVHGQSLAERLDEFSAAPELQSLLSMHSLLYGVDPTAASTTLNAQVAGSYYHSVHGIRGGGKALVDALMQLLTEAGGEVRCQADVTEITVRAGVTSGVRLVDGEEISGREVIATLNPTILPQLLPAGVLRPAYLKRLKKLRQTMSAYILFGRTRNPVAELECSNLFLAPRGGLFRAAVERPLDQRGCYLTAADGAADNGNGGVIGIVPASFTEVAQYELAEQQRGQGYRDKKQQLAEMLRLRFVNGCPALADLEVLDLATPLTLQDYSRAPQGAIYGVGHFIGQYNPHPVTRLPGLFLSGQATAAPGLLGTVVAAYITCGSILGHELLRGEIKSCR